MDKKKIKEKAREAAKFTYEVIDAEEEKSYATQSSTRG